jgi:SAM-dependent methyltransferase
MSAVETYAARVDAVLNQRTRLRGPAPPGDLFGGLPPEHPLLTADPHRPLDGMLETVAAYVEPDDVIVDAGGGAGRFSLPLALRCREVVNVDPSAAMLAAFEAHARRSGIDNVRVVHSDWLDVDPPRGTLALVNHVTYLTRDIVTFVRKLEAAASRRIVMTVGSPPPPARNRLVFEICYEEPSERVPGHVELVNVLWELGIEPDIRMLPLPAGPTVVAPSRVEAIGLAMAQLRGHQWAFWPLRPELDRLARQRIEARFGELFDETPGGYLPRWTVPAREVLITWRRQETEYKSQ